VQKYTLHWILLETSHGKMEPQLQLGRQFDNVGVLGKCPKSSDENWTTI